MISNNHFIAISEAVSISIYCKIPIFGKTDLISTWENWVIDLTCTVFVSKKGTNHLQWNQWKTVHYIPRIPVTL